MKRFYKFLMPLVAIVAMALPLSVQAQDVTSYTLSTGIDNTKWVTLSSSATAVTSIYDDDAYSSVMNIGFTFQFAGENYTQWSCNSNGRVALGATAVDEWWVNPFTPNFISYPRVVFPLIAAFGMDNTLAGSGAWCKYEVVGTAPNRTLVIEYRTPSEYDEEGDLVNYQIQLDEGTNVVRFVYGATAASYYGDFQAGMASAADDAITVSSTHTAIFGPTATTLDEWPGVGRYYEFAPPTSFCARGGNLELLTLTADSIAVSWTASSTASSYLVYLDSVEYTTSDTFYVFENLDPMTNYTVSVRTICTSGDTSGARTATYTTACGAATLPYTQNFDGLTTSTASNTGVLAPCWTYQMLNPSYATTSYLPQAYYGSSYASSGNYSLRLYGVSYTALPAMEAPVNELQIMFSHYTTSTSYLMQVGALEADGTFVPLATISDPSSTHVEHTLYLNNYTGNSHTIAFYNYYSTNGYSYHYIDDIYVDYLPTCSPVSNATATASVGAAVISWEAGNVGEYSGAYVEYKADTANTWQSMTVEGQSAVITGLDPTTVYTARVKALCDGNNDTAGLWRYVSFNTSEYACAEIDTANADTVSIGNGTSTTYYVPIGNYYRYSYTQELYTASEMGDSAMTITGLAFEYNYSTPSTVKNNVDIYLANVSVTSLTSSFVPYSSAFVKVYEGPLNCSQGWNYFELDAPFAYDGNSNLLLVVHDNSGNYNGSSYTFKSHSVSGKARYVQNDSNPYDITSVSGGSSYSYRVNTKFISASCVRMATCAAPILAVDSYDTTNVTLSWAPGGDETEWSLYIRQEGSESFSYVDNTSLMHYTFTDLLPGTKYYFRVVNTCGTDNYIAETSVFTNCTPVTHLVEDFENYATGASAEFNVCWNKDKYGTSTNYPYVNTVSNNKVMYFYGYYSGSSRYYSWLVTPQFADSLNGLHVEFDMQRTSTTAYYTAKIILGALSNPNDINSMDSITEFELRNTYDAGVFLHQDYIIENYTGNGKYLVFLAPAVEPFNGNTYSYNYVYLDNLFIEPADGCAHPTRFHTRDITSTSAEVAWDANANYNSVTVKWSTSNIAASAEDSVVVSDGNSAVMTGLTPNTTYYCWMTAHCEAGNSYTMTASFTTAPSCASVENLTVDNVGLTAATFSWTPSDLSVPTSYTFNWKADSATAWNTVTTSNTYYILRGLDEGVSYTASVAAVCNDDEASPVTVSFATLAFGTIGANEGTYYLPTYPYYNNSISEQLWLNSELSIYGDTIHGIYFNASSAISGRPMTIWMANTDLTDLSNTSYLPSTSMTQVYHGTYNIVEGWNYFPFSTPFVRTAGSNLAVMAYDSAAYETFSGWYACTSPVNSLFGYADNDVFSNTDLSGLNVAAVRSQMRLDATMTRPTCMAPYPVIADATANSITVAWTAGLNETSWTVGYRKLSDTVWTTLAASTTDTFAVANGLNSATRYVFRIGTLCGGDTLYSSVSGSTACGAFTVPYTENFNGMSTDDYEMNACWTKGSTGTSGTPYTVNITNEGMMSVMPRGSYIIFPTMDQPLSDLQLRLRYLTADTNIYSLVGVCTYPGDIYTFEVIDTLWNHVAGAGEWITTGFDEYEGSGQIAIYSKYNQSYVDDINIEFAPLCKPVDSVTITDITTTSATVNWASANNGTTYLVDYGPVGGSITTVSTTASSITLNGLNHSTSYHVSVRTVCSVLGDTSLATNFFTFISGCDAVDSLPYEQNFDNCNAPALTYTGILPNCWRSVVLATGTYATGNYLPQIYSNNSYSHSGQYSLMLYGKSIVLLPEMPVNVDTLMLSFHEYSTSTSYGLIIGVCDSNTAGFEASFVPVDTLTFNQAHTDVVSFALASYTGTGRYIGFQNFYTTNANTQFSQHYIDDLVVDYLPSCVPPQAVHAASNTSSSVNLTWTDLHPYDEWEVSYGTAPMADPSTGTVLNALSNPFDVTGLSDSLTYYFYVRSVCGNGDTSAWSSVFSTRPGIWVMRTNQTDTITMCGGTIYDDGGANGQYSDGQNSIVVVMPDGDNLVSLSGSVNTEECCDYLEIYDGIGTSGNLLWSGRGTATLTDIVSTEGPLTILFYSDGSVHSYNGFAISVSCVSNACPISDIHIDSTHNYSYSVGLAWAGSSTAYEVEIGPRGFTHGNGTTIATTTNSVVFNNLNASTNYDAYIRGFCDPDTSRWFLFSFTTPLCDDASIVSNYDPAASATTTSYGPIGYSCYNYSYVQIIIDSAKMAELGGDVTAFTFQPTNSAATYGSYFTNMDVYMANVSESTFSGSFITPDATHEFHHVLANGNLNYYDQNLQIVALDSAFTWDGHSNVLFAVNRQHGVYYCTAEFAAHSGSGNKMAYIYNDGSPYSITNPGTPYTTSTVGDLQFISCGAVGPCDDPIITSTVATETTITLSFTGTADEYEVAIDTVWNDATVMPVAVTDTFNTFANLTAATTYTIGVRSVCSASRTSEWATVTVTTDMHPCATPSGVTVMNRTYDGAQISWTPGEDETAWLVNIHCNSPAVDTNIEVNDQPQVTVTGLPSGVTYDVTVRAICAEEYYSEPTEVATLTTFECDVPNNVTATEITANSAKISWHGEGTHFRIEYGLSGFNVGQGTTVNVDNNDITSSTTTYTITGLTAGTMYDVYVRTLCSDNIISNWSSATTFETATVGIDDVTSSHVTLYPNPATTSVTISGLVGQAQVTVVDMNGRTVDEYTADDNTLTIDLTGYAQGAYFVRITGEQQSAIRKLIVK